MKKVSFIRTIDHQGRIVIPQDMRRALNIYENEPVELCLSGHELTIKKYQPLSTLASLCDDYLDALTMNCSLPVAICSTEYIVKSKWLVASSDKLLTEQLQTYINHQKGYRYSEESPLYLLDSVKQPIDTMYPIGKPGTPLGAVVLIHARNSTAEERICAKLVANLLTKTIIKE